MSEELLKKLRRLCGGADEYTDEELTELLTEQEDDVYAAAFEVWTMRAASAAGMYDFSADGGEYKRSQLYERYCQMAERCREKSPRLSALVLDPTLKRADDVFAG